MPHPCDGGCWFCHGTHGPLNFTTEFDAAVHDECVVNALADPDDPEAAIIARELDLSRPVSGHFRVALPPPASG